MSYNADTFNIGEVLKDVRTKANLSQMEFAQALGIKLSKLQNTENRPHDIKLKEFLRWCDHLGCDADYLLGKTTSPDLTIEGVCNMTGLGEATVKQLIDEKARPITAEVRNRKNAVIMGVTTADLIDHFLGFMGINLKNAMIQYTREIMVQKLLKDSVQNILDHRNEESGRADSFEGFEAWIDNVLTSTRLMSSLSGLTVAGMVQTKIDDDFTAFSDKLKDQKLTKVESMILFNYLQSKHRTEALKMTLYELMMKFCKDLSEEVENLKYHDKALGNYNVTASLLYEEFLEERERKKNDLLASALQKKMLKLKAENQRLKTAWTNSNEVNNRLSSELNDARWELKELKSQMEQQK